MYRIRYRISFYGLLSFITSIMMILLFNAMLNGFRFLQCTPWSFLSLAPENTTEILGSLKDSPYIGTSNGKIFCQKDQKWDSCISPPYGFQSDPAPFWTLNMLAQNFQGKNARKVIRSDGYFKTNYYSLFSNGEIYYCSTSIEDEINQIFSSIYFFWLLIPAIGFCLSFFLFIKSFLQQGDPTYWDFWGRGHKVK